MGISRARAMPCSPRSAPTDPDRKSTRLNSSHLVISYAVFCLKKKKQNSSYFLSRSSTRTLRLCSPIATHLISTLQPNSYHHPQIRAWHHSAHYALCPVPGLL